MIGHDGPRSQSSRIFSYTPNWMDRARAVERSSAFRSGISGTDPPFKSHAAGEADACAPMPAIAAAADRCRWGKSKEEFRPCATLPAEASVAQSLDGEPSDGEPAYPRGFSLGY